VKILLVAEGKHELGDGGGGGALAHLVARLLDRDVAFVTKWLKEAPMHVHRGKGRGFFVKAIRFMIDAARSPDKFDALVLVVDEDGQPDRIRQMDKAQGDQTSRIARALGVAVRSFDAWMLADERALSRVLAASVPRQPEIEEIRTPKETCTTLLEESDKSISLTELYAAVSREAKLSVLIGRCPTGFAPFAERVRAMA